MTVQEMKEHLPVREYSFKIDSGATLESIQQALDAAKEIDPELAFDVINQSPKFADDLRLMVRTTRLAGNQLSATEGWTAMVSSHFPSDIWYNLIIDSSQYGESLTESYNAVLSSLELPPIEEKATKQSNGNHVIECISTEATLMELLSNEQFTAVTGFQEIDTEQVIPKHEAYDSLQVVFNQIYERRAG